MSAFSQHSFCGGEAARDRLADAVGLYYFELLENRACRYADVAQVGRACGENAETSRPARVFFELLSLAQRHFYLCKKHRCLVVRLQLFTLRFGTRPQSSINFFDGGRSFLLQPTTVFVGGGSRGLTCVLSPQRPCYVGSAGGGRDSRELARGLREEEVGGGTALQGGRALGFCISRASGGWVRCVRRTELAHIKIMSTDVWARRNPIQPVPRLPSGSKERFVDDYLNPALPVVLEGHARDWPAFARWDFSFLVSECGGDPVLLMLDGDRSNGSRRQSTVADFIHSFRPRDVIDLSDTDEATSTGFGGGLGTACPADQAASVPYLREWAFAKRHPELLADCSPHAEHFFADGFKALPEDQRPPLIWLFVGPGGTYTPLHKDLWNTDAWIAQIRGRKLCRLWHPDDAPTLSRGDSFVDFSRGDSVAAYPGARRAGALRRFWSPGTCCTCRRTGCMRSSPWRIRSLSRPTSWGRRGAHLVRPHHDEWLARRAVSREIESVTKRLRAIASVEALRDGGMDSSDEEDGGTTGTRALSGAQQTLLAEKPGLESRLQKLKALPKLGGWTPTTL